MRRPNATRIERTTCKLVGLPSETKPARRVFHSGASASNWVRMSRGSAKSSKK